MAERPVSIDGSQGEGGGQILRSSLALALVTGRPVILANIRAGRDKPGLLRQHLAAVRAAAEIGAAEVVSDEISAEYEWGLWFQALRGLVEMFDPSTSADVIRTFKVVKDILRQNRMFERFTGELKYPDYQQFRNGLISLGIHSDI